MRWLARRTRSTTRKARVLTLALAAVVTCGSMLLLPAYVGASAFTPHHGGTTPAAAALQAAIAGTATPFGGTAAIGALFTVTDGQPDTHFCTASVVHSAHGNLAVTAAHCVTGVEGPFAFVPGYASGKKPHGVWAVTAIYTDSAWQSSQDPDDDVAFLRLSGASGGPPVESVTGAERLGINSKVPVLVRVTGYPDGADQPVSCVNWARRFSATQLEFDCDGFTDGTSGGPFLAGTTSATGSGTVIGVIGGYEQGGDIPAVSYAPAFGPSVAALYRTAVARG